MPRITLIDDEKDARTGLRLLLTQHCSQVEIVGEGDGVHTGVQLIRRTQPDAILLDIAMQDGSGFDLLDYFPRPNFHNGLRPICYQSF